MAGSKASLAGSWDLKGGRMYIVFKDGWKISPFYRTLSPISAAALLHIHESYRIHKQGTGTADYMMSVGDWLMGSGPDRGQSPVEWGEIPSIHPSIRTSVPPFSIQGV